MVFITLNINTYVESFKMILSKPKRMEKEKSNGFCLVRDFFLPRRRKKVAGVYYRQANVDAAILINGQNFVPAVR